MILTTRRKKRRQIALQASDGHYQIPRLKHVSSVRPYLYDHDEYAIRTFTPFECLFKWFVAIAEAFRTCLGFETYYRELIIEIVEFTRPSRIFYFILFLAGRMFLDIEKWKCFRSWNGSAHSDFVLLVASFDLKSGACRARDFLNA